MSGLEEVLRAHLGECGRFGLPCTEVRPRDEWCGRCDLTAHVAAAVTAWITERLASEDVREAVARSLHVRIMPGQQHPAGDPRREWPCMEYATAALTAVTDALKGEA